MKLTDIAIKNAKPKDKPFSIFDGQGLHIEVYPNGRKFWRRKFRFQGKSNRLSLGEYPYTSLRDARDKNEEIQYQIEKGINPSEARKKEQRSQEADDKETFESVAKAWFASRRVKWAQANITGVSRMLEQILYPGIGSYQIGEITSPMLLKTLQEVEAQGKHETALRAKQIASQVFRYGVAEGKAERDITVDLRGILTTPRVKHRAAITDPKEFGRFLLACETYQGSPQVCSALRFAPYVFVRPGELRNAEWDEINFEESLWTIPADKKKERRDFLVPLAPSARKILLDIQKITGGGRYVFPSTRSKNRPMSENTLLIAIRTIGYDKDQMSIHGLRASMRTIGDEYLKLDRELIEIQLAHKTNRLGMAYSRGLYLEDRIELMRQWALGIDKLREEAASGNG